MSQDKSLPRIRWRESPIEGETQSEQERLAAAAVPYVRTGKSIYQAVDLAQEVLPVDRRRGKLTGKHQVPPRLIKLIERAVEDSLGSAVPLPKVPNVGEPRYPQVVLDALAFKQSHRCPTPISPDVVLEAWLVELGVTIAKGLLSDPKVGAVIRSMLGELLPKRQTTFERVTQGTSDYMLDKPLPESAPPIGVRKPVVLVVGPKPGIERDAYIRELGAALDMKFFDGHTEGRGGRKLANMAGGVDQAFVITAASDHEQVYALQKLAVPIINSNQGRSGTIELIKDWAKRKGVMP